MTYLLLVAGLVALLLGGEALVRGAVGVARHFGLPPLLIGLTLVGFGTSTPELLTSVKAALAGSPGVAVGNVVGSNIANILLILGAAAVIHPMNSDLPALRRDGSMMLFGALVCVALGLYGAVGRPIGAAMIVILIAYIVIAYVAERRKGKGQNGAPSPAHEEASEEPLRRRFALVQSAGFGLAGLGLVMLGADWLVRAAISLARDVGISEAVIGLTVVAVGTSLPELATSCIAAFRRNSDIAIGNIVGSNIYNVFGILGAAAVIQPIEIPDRIAGFDNWAMLAVTLAFLWFAATGARITRREGVVFLFAYGAYIFWLGLEGYA